MTLNTILHPPKSDTDPGTPDSDVSPVRLAGRERYRQAPEDQRGADEQARGMEKDHRFDFWRGWYDERLRRIYGR